MMMMMIVGGAWGWEEARVGLEEARVGWEEARVGWEEARVQGDVWWRGHTRVKGQGRAWKDEAGWEKTTQQRQGSDGPSGRGVRFLRMRPVKGGRGPITCAAS